MDRTLVWFKYRPVTPISDLNHEGSRNPGSHAGFPAFLGAKNCETLRREAGLPRREAVAGQ